MFREEYKMLENNKELVRKVKKFLLSKGLKSELKGFEYLTDIIVLAKLKKKYSITTIKELSPFISHKYGIKAYSVQRQLRYTCTLATAKEYLPFDLLVEAWNTL